MIKFAYLRLVLFSFLLLSLPPSISSAGPESATLSEPDQGSSLHRSEASFLFTHPMESIFIAVSLSALIFFLALLAMRTRYLRKESKSVSSAREALERDTLERTAEISSAKERLEREIEVRSQTAATLRAVVDTITETLVVLDPDGKAIMVNEVAARRLGRTPGEIEGTNIFELFPEDIKARRRAVFEEAIKTGSPLRTVDTRDGRQYETNWYPISDKAGRFTYMAVFAVDITKRGRAEEERIRTEKIESIGLLAGGIAHDCNNLLTGIMGFVDLSKTFSQPDSGQHKYLSEALALCHRAKELTRRFTTFSRGGDPVMRAVKISSLIKDTIMLVLSGSNVDSEISLPEHIWEVDCDERQMRDVFTSIITNAKEAMPSSGRIEVSVANIDELPADLPGIPAQIRDGWVYVAISDTGIGIPAENLPKLFLPYFSTKQRGAQKGMGLSLPTAYSIIKRHGGTIHVESELGRGTTVHIYLPRAASASRPGLEDREEQAAGTERILIMDDEDTVLDVAASILERGGFEVTACREGKEALELYRKAMEEKNPFTGVILDLTIRGGIGGRDVVKELLLIDPHVKAIVSSGYSEDPVMSNYSAFGFCGAVAKPYDIKLLLRAANRAFRTRSAKPVDRGSSCANAASKDNP